MARCLISRLRVSVRIHFTREELRGRGGRERHRREDARGQRRVLPRSLRHRAFPGSAARAGCVQLVVCAGSLIRWPLIFWETNTCTHKFNGHTAPPLKTRLDRALRVNADASPDVAMETLGPDPAGQSWIPLGGQDRNGLRSRSCLCAVTRRGQVSP